MKQRKWEGKWKTGILRLAEVPFNPPARLGQVVYYRLCDLGLAVFTYGEDSWINYIDPKETEEGWFEDGGLYKGDLDRDKVFDLVRHEWLTEAATFMPTSLSGEVPLPKGVPATYGGARVHVASGINWVREPVFYGEHYWDQEGDAHIVLQTEVLYAALGMGDQEFITKTLEHETRERRLKFGYMEADYGKVEPRKWQWLADQFDGISHVEVVHTVEGFKTVKAYDRFLDKWAAKAKLPIPPSPEEE